MTAGVANAADINFASSLAEQYGPLGIRVNTVNPGPVNTDRWDGLEKAFARLGRPAGGLRLYRADGCAACGGTGYKGRTGIHELLVVTPEIRSLIHARAPISEVQRTAVSQGMTTLCQDGLMKCLAGQTDLRQVVAKTG